MPKVKTLIDERNEALEAAQAIMDLGETRSLTPDERGEFETRTARVRDLNTQIRTLEESNEARRGFDELLSSGNVTGTPEARGGRTVERTTATTPAADQAVLVPSLNEYRAAQAEGADATGGFTTPIEQASTIVDRLRPASVLLTAGPRLFVMSSDVLRVPMIGTSATASMVLENAPIPESTLTFAAATFTARKLAGLVRASNEWLADSVPGGRLIVEQDLMRTIGELLDVQLFAGSGVAPNIRGLLNVVGLHSTTGLITLDAISAAIERVETAGGAPNAIFMSPAAWGTVSRLKDTATRYMLMPDPTSEGRRQLFGLRVYVSSNLTTQVIVADMSTIGVGVRDRMNVFFDPFRYSEFDQSAVRVTSRWDLEVLNLDGIELLTGVV